MQNDPIGDDGGSLNWYFYVANNSINYKDPSGLYSLECQIAINSTVLLWFPVKLGIYDDRLVHCLSACMLAKYCGKNTTYLLGYIKEHADELGGKLGIYPGGYFDNEDLYSNWIGARCPKDKTCKEQCKSYGPLK